MATEKLTVSVEANSIRRIDRWVAEGRYKNRSKATQAALDLLAHHNRLPTLEETLAAYASRYAAATSEERAAWQAELDAIEGAQDALEPLFPDDNQDAA